MASPRGCALGWARVGVPDTFIDGNIAGATTHRPVPLGQRASAHPCNIVIGHRRMLRKTAGRGDQRHRMRLGSQRHHRSNRAAHKSCVLYKRGVPRAPRPCAHVDGRDTDVSGGRLGEPPRDGRQARIWDADGALQGPRYLRAARTSAPCTLIPLDGFTRTEFRPQQRLSTSSKP